MFVSVVNCHPEQYEHDIVKQEALEKLLEAHGKRKHIVYCKKSTCQSVLDCGFYGSRQKKYASDLMESKGEIGSVKNAFALTIHFDFTIEDENIISVHSEENKNRITCSYKLLNTPSFYDCAILLGEDNSDCELYNIIAKLYAKKSVGNNVSSTFQFLEGGGSRTHPKYTDMMNNGKFGICIIDNDQKHPEGAEGDTAKAFVSERGQRGLYRNQECLVLDFHEAESIIPDDIISKVMDKSKVDAFDTMTRLEKESDFEFRKYFDHKNGLTLADGWKYDSGRTNKFWRNMFRTAYNFNIKPCRDGERCVNTQGRTSCEACIKLDGFGQHLLVQSLEEMQQVNLRKTSETFTPHIEEQWNLIGKKVLDWGCKLTLPAIRSC